MIRNLSTPNSGFGAYFYPEPYLLQVPKENIKTFANGIKKYGNYANIPAYWWEYSIPNIWKDDVVAPLPSLDA